jgi:hypothetical protein
MTDKPKAILFYPILKSDVHPFIRQFVFEDRIKIFSLYFEIVYIVQNTENYNDLLLKYKPDILICLYTPMFQQYIELQNVFENNQIPKIGFLCCDGFATERNEIFNYYENYIGVDAYFTQETTFGGIDYQYLSYKIFYFPWSIDKEVYKNYNLEKTHKIILLGNHGYTYPWRTEIFPIVEQEYEHYRLQYPKDGKGIYGADFSKIINQSTFAPTCGGYTDILVRKHFEIPASYCCLITEKTEATLQAGFIDMENCVFANKDNFREKMNFLLQNPEKVKEITKKGYEFVQQNHTDEQRTQILDWYYLFKEKKENPKKENQHIIQTSLFAKLELSDNPEKHYHQKENKFTRLSDEANTLFWQCDIKGFRDKYEWAHKNYLYYSPDILVPLTLADICLGNLDEAVQCLKHTLEFETQNNLLPNLIEYSLILLSINCKKKSKKIINYIFAEELGKLRWYDAVVCLWAIKNQHKDIENLCLYYLKNNNYTTFKNTYTFFDISFEKITFILEIICKKNKQEFYFNKFLRNYKKFKKNELKYNLLLQNPTNTGQVIYEIYYFYYQKPLRIRIFNKIKSIVKKIIGRK